MKTFFTFLVGLAFAWSVSGQDTLYIYQSGGQINKLATAAIDSIIFIGPLKLRLLISMGIYTKPLGLAPKPGWLLTLK